MRLGRRGLREVVRAPQARRYGAVLQGGGSNDEDRFCIPRVNTPATNTLTQRLLLFFLLLLNLMTIRPGRPRGIPVCRPGRAKAGHLARGGPPVGGSRSRTRDGGAPWRRRRVRRRRGRLERVSFGPVSGGYGKERSRCRRRRCSLEAAGGGGQGDRSSTS